jgi:signal transduction histidine kinase
VHEKLPAIFATIEERARHLEGFIRGYAHFAKLPMPRTETVAWAEFVARLRSQIPFSIDGELPEQRASFDLAQMEQALLNLLKNAHESGSKAEDVCLRVRQVGALLRIEVMDRGTA